MQAIFTNEQIANISEKRPKSLSDLKKIDGIGEKRLNNYGDIIIKIVKEMDDKQKKNKEENENKADEKGIKQVQQTTIEDMGKK